MNAEYDSCMTTIVRSQSDPKVLEPRPIAAQPANVPALPEWCNVFADRTPDEIDSLDEAITRIRTTRNPD